MVIIDYCVFCKKCAIMFYMRKYCYNQKSFKHTFVTTYMKWFFLVILLLCFAVPVQGADILEIGISTDKPTYEAGERGSLNVIFTNSSGQLVEDIHAEVKSSDILFMTKTGSIESIEYGSKTLSFKFHVKNVEEGEYPVTISYAYKATSKICQGGTCQNVSDSTLYNIAIKNGEPHISLESNLLRVENNKTVIRFRNIDEVALDFQFEITSSLTLQYESYIGSLLTSGSKEIVVYGEPGEYDGSVIVKYRDRFGREYTKEFLLRIIIPGEKEEKVAVLNPQSTAPQIRKIQINVAAASESAPVSQYYVYLIVFSCLSLIGVAAAVKLKNFGR